MSIYIVRFRKTDTSNASMSLVSGKKMRFQVPPMTRPDLTPGSRNETSNKFKTVGATGLGKPKCQMCCDGTAEYFVCDGWPNGDVGGRKLWR